jgi:hypothetical protein
MFRCLYENCATLCPFPHCSNGCLGRDVECTTVLHWRLVELPSEVILSSKEVLSPMYIVEDLLQAIAVQNYTVQYTFMLQIDNITTYHLVLQCS